MYADLHMHLYGCFSPEMLLEIGRKNPAPKWERFLPDFKKEFGFQPDEKSFFETYGNLEKFKELYLFNHHGPFSQFQAKFNLIIALTQFNEEEIRSVITPILSEQQKQGISFGEYRIMYSPFETENGYIHKTIAACEGMAEAESSLTNIQGRLSLSLHRQGDYESKYTLIKELMAKNSLVKKYLTSIDFCHIEENHAPSEKIPFFQRILKDNHSDPASALAILYHVGESYKDKSPKSAARWVIQSAMAGVHRLGHCLALGLDPSFHLNEIVEETASERLAELVFEQKYHREIQHHGEITPMIEIEKEMNRLQNIPTHTRIKIKIDEKYTKELQAIQEFGFNRILEKGNVIESCPTSNAYIGNIENPIDHPIKRFADTGIKLTIGTDDPGIFDTNIQREYALAREAGMDSSQLETIRQNSFLYRAENIVRNE